MEKTGKIDDTYAQPFQREIEGGRRKKGVLQFPGNGLEVHEVAETSSGTLTDTKKNEEKQNSCNQR